MSAVVFFAGCSKDGKDPCAAPPPPAPAFRIEITPDRGTLPPGTTLQVKYGGTQSESYTIGGANRGNEDVCCRPGVAATSGALPSVSCLQPDSGALPDGGAPDGSGLVVLDCELWTNGTADVSITAPGFPPLERFLDARQRADQCGVETSDERIVLLRADSGN